MFSENRGITITIILVVIISIAALVAVLYSLVIAIRQVQFGEVTALQPDRNVNVLERDYNYNFAIPTQEIVQEETTTNNEAEDKQNYNYNFPIESTEKTPEMLSIQIPAINYYSPIIISDDGDSAIDQGAWYYPSNHPKEGEAIFLCHRRYFKAQDPKSCWNLDKVNQGAHLYINYKNGSQDFYKVESISVTSGDDLNIYHTSDEKVIKLVSCAKSNGKIGSDSHRIVLLARAVN